MICDMTTSIFDRLRALLDQNHVHYDVLRHAPVYTSEEAAQVRGTTLASGAKALICKADREFVLIVLPADCRLASKQVRKIRSLKSLRFASRDEVYRLTGLTPGAIPPFGSLFDMATWCDRRLGEQTAINFNAGDHEISIQMTFTDYERVERPLFGGFGGS